METAVIDGTGPKVLVCILQFYFSTINWHINKADSMIKVRQFSRMSLGNIKCAIQLITEIPALSFLRKPVLMQMRNVDVNTIALKVFSSVSRIPTKTDRTCCLKLS